MLSGSGHSSARCRNTHLYLNDIHSQPNLPYSVLVSHTAHPGTWATMTPEYSTRSWKRPQLGRREVHRRSYGTDLPAIDAPRRSPRPLERDRQAHVQPCTRFWSPGQLKKSTGTASLDVCAPWYQY